MQFTSSVPENFRTPKTSESEETFAADSPSAPPKLEILSGNKPRPSRQSASSPEYSRLGAQRHQNPNHKKQAGMPSPYRNRVLPQVENNEIQVCDLESLARMWLEIGKRENTADTIAAKRDMTARFLWFLNDRGYEFCGTAEIEAYLLHVTDGHNEPDGRWGNPANRRPMRPITVRGHYNIVRALFAFIVKRGFLATSPAAVINAPKATKDRLFLFSGDEVKSLLAACEHSWHPRRDYAIVYLLYDTGLRASELCSLNRCDFDTRNQRLTVQGKGNKIRVLHVGDAAFKAVWDYLREENLTPDLPLFRLSRGNTRGRRLTKRALAYLVASLGKTAGVTGTRCSPHTFRHTFATHFLKRGGNVYALRDLLGHTTLNTTMIYAHLAQVDVQAQHGQFSPGDWLAGLRKEK